MEPWYYEPMLCPRCKTNINNINEVHKTKDYKICAPKKVSKGAYVYLMKDEHRNLYKIGYSEDPLRRHKEVSQANTNTITLIGFFPGSKTNENLVHKRFKEQRIDREWFESDEKILEYFTYHPNFTEK